MFSLCIGDPHQSINSPFLLELLRSRDPLEELGCSDLHATALGLDPTRLSIEDRLALTSRDAIDKPDRVGRTALSWVSQKADIKVMKLLLMKGANPNSPDNKGDTPFYHCANDHHCLTTLLEAGAAVNYRNPRGWTKLMKLITLIDDVRCTQTLWQFGYDLNVSTVEGWTPLHLAVEYGQVQTVEWLLEKQVQLEQSNIYGQTPLLRCLNPSEGPPSWMAQGVKMLLECGANYKVKDINKEGILHYVARFGGSAVISLLRQVDLSGLEVSARNTCGIDLRDEVLIGMTPMELAAYRRDHNDQFALMNQTPLDDNPKGWYLAYELFIDSLIANESIEHISEFWESLENSDGGMLSASDSSRNENGMGLDKNIRVQEEYDCRDLPGTFPV